jgi:hypothetical protein
MPAEQPLRLIGGSHIGPNRWFSWNFVWRTGFAELEVTADCIILFHGWYYLRFTKETLTRIEETNSGVRLFHNEDRYPKYVEFRKLNVPKLKRELGEMGWLVEIHEARTTER